MHNEVVKSDIHSTDTGGYTEMLFGVMRLLGFSYAPRIKGFSSSNGTASAAARSTSSRATASSPTATSTRP